MVRFYFCVSLWMCFIWICRLSLSRLFFTVGGHHAIHWGTQLKVEGESRILSFCWNFLLSCNIDAVVPMDSYFQHRCFRFSGLQTWIRNIPLAFLGLQLVGGKLWDFSGSIVTWTNYLQSISLYIYGYVCLSTYLLIYLYFPFYKSYIYYYFSGDPRLTLGFSDEER